MIDVAHTSWRPIIAAGLNAIDAAFPDYLASVADDHFLPNGGRVFAAFTQPINAVHYVLVGEGPYPRPDSATGVCFMDGAVGKLWCDSGLSKPVNRATSLRNFMKMLLVAGGQLQPGATGVYIVVATVPAGVPAGEAVPVIVTAGSLPSPPATMAVQ